MNLLFPAGLAVFKAQLSTHPAKASPGQYMNHHHLDNNLFYRHSTAATVHTHIQRLQNMGKLSLVVSTSILRHLQRHWAQIPIAQHHPMPYCLACCLPSRGPLLRETSTGDDYDCCLADLRAMGREERDMERRTNQWTVDAFGIGDGHFRLVPYNVLGTQCDIQMTNRSRARYFVHKILPDLATSNKIERCRHQGAHRRQDLGWDPNNRDFQESKTILLGAI